MTLDGFRNLIDFLEGAYNATFTDGSKEAWFLLLEKQEDAVAMKAARMMAAEPELFKPQIGKLLDFCNKQALDREKATWSMDRPAAMRSLGNLARVVKESLADKRWKPETQIERDAAHLFSELIAEAHGMLEPTRGRRQVSRPESSIAGHKALQEVGGFEVLRDLGCHDILIAREAFCRAYIKAAGDGQ